MPLDMNPQIRAQWCAALRSGNYQQGSGKLCRSGRRCCLGVLADLAEKAGAIGSITRHPHGWTEYDGCSDWLPDSIMEWAGLADHNPRVTASFGVASEKLTLAVINDEYGKSFAEIADLIDGGAS